MKRQGFDRERIHRIITAVLLGLVVDIIVANLGGQLIGLIAGILVGVGAILIQYWVAQTKLPKNPQ